jgi:hypothetical protein
MHWKRQYTDLYHKSVLSHVDRSLYEYPLRDCYPVPWFKRAPKHSRLGPRIWMNLSCKIVHDVLRRKCKTCLKTPSNILANPPTRGVHKIRIVCRYRHENCCSNTLLDTRWNKRCDIDRRTFIRKASGISQKSSGIQLALDEHRNEDDCTRAGPTTIQWGLCPVYRSFQLRKNGIQQ